MHVVSGLQVLLLTIALALSPLPAIAQSDGRLAALNQRVAAFLSAGRFAEALPEAHRARVLAEQQFGPQHTEVALPLHNLGALHRRLGQYAEAEPFYKRALEIREKMLGPEHADVGHTLLEMGNLQRQRGRYAEAEQTIKRSIAILEKALGPDHPHFALGVNDLGIVYRAFGRNVEAEQLYKRALEIREKALGPDHEDVAESLSNLGMLSAAIGRRSEAETLMKRALAIRETVLGPEHPAVASTLTNLAQVYIGLARYADGEPLYKRSLAIREKVLGGEHDLVATTLGSLGDLYRIQGRYVEAEPLFKRALSIVEKVHGPEHVSVANALSNVASLVRAQNRYAESEMLLKRALVIREKALGAEHGAVGISLDVLASTVRDQERYAEAEPLFKRALAIKEAAYGRDHETVATTTGNIAELYRIQGRYAEAEPLYERALATFEKVNGAQHPRVATALSDLANLLRLQGRYAEAEQMLRRTMDVREKTLGTEHLAVAGALASLALLVRDQGRYAEAEMLLKRALAIREKAWGADHDLVASNLTGLAELYRYQGRLAEAESLYRRALASLEKMYGPNSASLAGALSGFALLLRDQGRHREAEPLYKRVMDMYQKTFGPDHPNVAASLNNLANLYSWQRRYADAEPLWKRVRAIQEKTLGADHVHVSITLSSLATMYRDQARHAEAEPLFKQALAIQEKALGADHPTVANTLGHLGATYQFQGRHAEAEPCYQRALAIREKALGPDHRSVGHSINSLAALEFERQNWGKAVELLERSTLMTIRRQKREGDSIGHHPAGRSDVESALESATFVRLIKASYRLAAADRQRGAAIAAQTFVPAQWARGSQAAASLAQMAAREAKGDGALSNLVRERQDLLREWRTREVALIATEGGGAETDTPQARQALRTRLANIDARIKEIDATLAARFPEYTALANPEPLSIAEVQQHLAADEALVFFLDTRAVKPLPEETFVWIVTKTTWRSYSLERGTQAVMQRVAALRCGLDQAAWFGDGAMRCTNLLGRTHLVAATDSDALPPFDLALAYDLYRGLFGRAEDLLSGKSLIIVPMGPLTALPFQVLVTAKPADAVPTKPADYADVEWLIKRHAMTVLPSVTSLKALRQFAKVSRATQPFIGFGNPLLTGPENADKRAWDRQRCTPSPTLAPVQVASRSVRTATPKFFRGGLADVDEVRRQYPLPETADELCAVAQLAGARDDSVHLGAEATERKVKALSAEGTLARARVIHFATHGLLAGETEMLAAANAEPALLLTPPAQATEEDDGLLTASEVANLKLDADWVVLSACNTASAASDKLDAEALSGLTRAFFYAGARALLVSHWAVNSEATVRLIIKAFDELKADPRIGRAEALRRSMLGLIKQSGNYAHPANWAPFVVVGEGAAR